MAVTAQNPVNEYIGNASVTTFSYTFYLLSEDDLKVYVDGVLQSASAYTVSGLSNPSGGSVTFLAAPASGAIVRLQRIVLLTRSIDYLNGGGLQADVLDEDIDRVVMQVQDLNRVAFKEGSLGNYDASNKKIVNLATPTINTDAATKQYVDTQVITGGSGGVYHTESFTATSGQTVFTLAYSYTPGINSIRVYINGVHQSPSAFTETSSVTITFSEGLEADDLVDVVYVVPVVVNTVSAGNVTTSSGQNLQAVLNDILQRLTAHGI